MKRHLKSLAAPKSWPIQRKGTKFVTKPRAGPHPLKLGIPLLVYLRNVLKLAPSQREIKYILFNQGVLVDCVRRTDPKFIVGCMDTVSIPKIKSYTRVLVNKKGKIDFVKIREEESKLKPCKIIGKTLAKRRTQINLFDGKNIFIEKCPYKVGDSLVLELPGLNIKEHLKMDVGARIFLTAGKHIGEGGVVEEIKGNYLVYKRKTGEKFETKRDYAFVIGKDKPIIKIEKDESDEGNKN